MGTRMAGATAAMAAISVQLNGISMIRDCTTQQRVSPGSGERAVPRHQVAGRALLVALSKWTERGRPDRDGCGEGGLRVAWPVEARGFEPLGIGVTGPPGHPAAPTDRSTRGSDPLRPPLGSLGGGFALYRETFFH